MSEIINLLSIAIIISLLVYIILVKLNKKSKHSDKTSGVSEYNSEVFEDHEKKIKKYMNESNTDIKNTKSQHFLLAENDNFSNDFKNKYFEFRDKINQPSNMEVDPVDNINNFAYQDFEKVQGKKISDVYDELLNTNNGTIQDSDKSNLQYSSGMNDEQLDGSNGKLYDGYHWITKPNEQTNGLMANDVSVNPSMAW